MPTVTSSSTSSHGSLYLGLLLVFSLFFVSPSLFAQSSGDNPAAPSLQVHPWQGAHVAVFGDSISDPSFRDRGVKHYWSFLQEWLGWSVYNYAISGRQWNDIPRQEGALKREHGDDVDGILILMGTNDYNHDVPLGEWFKVEKVSVPASNDGTPATPKVRLHRVPCMDSETLRGRINKALYEIKQDYPTVPVVLMTLPHRGYFYAGENNVQPDEYHANSLGLWVDGYSEAIREAGRIWAVPVVDLETLLGFTPMVPSQKAYYLGNDGNDFLHPATPGHERMARILFHALSSVPL